MKKLGLVFILWASFCWGQKMSFVYEQKCRLNKQFPDKISKYTTILDFSDGYSIYRENYYKKFDSLKLKGRVAMVPDGFENKFYIKKDLVNNTITKVINHKEFDYALPIVDALNWKILPEKKKKGIYNTQKATVNYGGREWIAWFTNDIPVNDGPYVFHGLPGLIVAIHDSEEDYTFHLVQVKKMENLFDTRTNLINIDWDKYKELAVTYYLHPNLDLEQKIKAGATIRMTDADGMPMKFDMRAFNKEQQDPIRENNNPIELNHRIDYDAL